MRAARRQGAARTRRQGPADRRPRLGGRASGAFANAGQICTSVERIYVHADLTEDFVAALVAEAGRLRVGAGLDPDTTMGPLVDRLSADQLTHCQEEMAVMSEETFGPVAALTVVSSFDEALRRANASAYGLAATVLTPDMANAQRAWRERRAR